MAVLIAFVATPFVHNVGKCNMELKGGLLDGFGSASYGVVEVAVRIGRENLSVMFINDVETCSKR